VLGRGLLGLAAAADLFEIFKIRNFQILVIWETFFRKLMGHEPITVPARSKAWTVFVRSNAGIVGSNPIQSMDVCIVCVYSVFVLFCV
jgi:hypothetical protein